MNCYQWRALVRSGEHQQSAGRPRTPAVAEHGGYLLDHLEVDVKHNETSHLTELLELLDLGGAVATFDALHTVRANLNRLAWEKKTATSKVYRETAYTVTGE
jgi:hypothetical protein